MHHSLALEEMSRAICAAHLAEAARDRLALEAAGPRRSVRVAVAAALRTLASQLDNAPTAGDRRLARAH